MKKYGRGEKLSILDLLMAFNAIEIMIIISRMKFHEVFYRCGGGLTFIIIPKLKRPKYFGLTGRSDVSHVFDNTDE